MRTRLLAVAATLLLGPALASAQPAAQRWPGSIEIGVRATDLRGDAARFQHFRDAGDGLFLQRLRLTRTGSDWRFDASAENAGRTDQRYWLDLRGGGRWRVSFTWDQIPLFNSADTRTPYGVEAPGVLRLPDALQQGIQSGTLRLSDMAAAADPFSVRSRRDVALFSAAYQATKDVGVTLNLRTAHREGTMPMGATFGMSNYVEVPAPIDTRTTDLATAAEWTTARGLLRIGYDGSWFSNAVPALVWDNPLRLTPTATLPSEGRYALWPNSSLHAVTTTAAANLPMRTRVSGHVSVGTWRQNDTLQPFTINPLATQQALDRPSAEGQARTLAMNYTATSRPVRYLWLNARVRYYDFDNRTPEFHLTRYVRFDSTPSTITPHSRPLGQTRTNVDLDASFTPIPFTALRVGYGREATDRTYRIFRKTTENTFRTSLDSTLASWGMVRAIFERTVRDGSGFDEAVLTDVGEQPLMRHFDIADRDRRRVTALVQLLPHAALGLTASASLGTDDYSGSGLGLRDSEARTYAVGADLAPLDRLAAGLTYTNERFSARQRSRTSSNNAQFADPLRDWLLDHDDRVHTITATLDLLRALPDTEVRLSYDASRSRATYLHRLPPGSTLAAPQLLPSVRHDLRNAVADMRYFLTARVAVGVVYSYDRYRVDDFALGEPTMNRLDLPGSLYLGYVYRPYTAHSAWLRLSYLW
jgi:MtrB/PioB family decaheme-associated outer membrane protein